jgi:hypothetical protein
MELLRSSATNSEEREIVEVVGQRSLTDDERETLRSLLAARMSIHPDGEPTDEARELDEVVGLLADY